MTGEREHKLPVRQLTILAICRFAEPIALTSVNPYLPEMMSFFVPPSSVAKWAGIAMSVFSLAQCLTGIPWGRASDRFGRKPTIILSLFNTLITTILWGFSTSLPMAVVVRALAGAGNGNVGVIRTAVAELVPWKELQPRAFSIMPIVWNTGSVLGPALGGAMANPLRVPPEKNGTRGMRKDGSFLERFPFVLPNLLAAALFIISLINCIFFLRESLESRQNRYDAGLAVGDKFISFFNRRIHGIRNLLRRQKGMEEEPLLKSNSTSGTATADEEFNDQVESIKSTSAPHQKTSYRDVLTNQSVLNLFVYTVLATHSMGFDQLIPVYLHQERQSPSDPAVSPPFRFKGGFEICMFFCTLLTPLTASQSIGVLLTFYGIFGLFIQFFIFPPAARKFGVLRVFHICLFAFPIVYLIVPFTALLPATVAAPTNHIRSVDAALNSANQDGSTFRIPFNVLVLFLVMLFKCSAAVFAFPCSTILLTNSASSLAVLGTLNGISTSISAVGRAAGPVIGGYLLGWGVERNLAWLPWWTFAVISIVGAAASLWLIEGEGFGDDEDGEEDVNGSDRREDDEIEERLRGHGAEAHSGDGQTGELRRDGYKFRRSRTPSLTALQESAIDEEPEDEDNILSSPAVSRPHHRQGSIVSTVPIGMGKGISRKLSSNLGQSLGSQHSFGE